MSSDKISPFISKLYRIIDNKANNNIIKWESNCSFKIINREKLCNEILSLHFKTRSFTSFIRQLNKYDFKKTRCESIFKHPYFRKSDTESLGRIIAKGSIGTFREIKSNKLSISLFNLTVVNSIEKITNILEKQVFTNKQNLIRILVFENFEFKEISNRLKHDNLKVKQVFFYNEFERKITKEKFNYLIIDQNFYEIYKRECFESGDSMKIIVTWDNEKIGNQSNAYKAIKKPYGYNEISSIIQIGM